MTLISKYSLKQHVRDSYLELVAAFPLTSIRSEEHLAAAQTFMDSLLTQKKLHRGEELYLDALSDLIAAYEDEHYPVKAASDADMLRHLMEAKGVTQNEISRQTGVSKSTISEVLSGKRPFSRQMIRKFADYFKVNVSVLAVNI